MSLEEIEEQYFTRVPIRELFSEIEAIYNQSESGSDAHARAAYLIGAYYQPRDQAKAAEYYATAKKTAIKVGNKRLLSDLMHLESESAFRGGDLMAVNRIEQKALELALAVGHVSGITFSYYLLGLVALNCGQNEIGLSYLDKALHISQHNGLLKWQIRLYSYLAESHLSSGNPAVSRHYAKEALRVATELSMRQATLESSIRLATVELELGRLSAAKKLVIRVRRVLPTEDRALWCTTHTILAKIHEAQRSYGNAVTEFQTALLLADYRGAERVRSSVRTHLAVLYLKRKKPKLALKESLAALEDAEKAQDMYVRKEALRAVHNAYKVLGNYKQANTYLERYNDLIAESDTALMRTRLEYFTLKSDYEQEKLRSEKGLKDAELLRIKLEYKEQELAENLQHLIRQADALRQYRSDLNALIRRSSASDPTVQAIRSRLSDFPEQELNWQEFEKQFNEVHPEFMQKLSGRFESLTNMEQRVAAMIQMKLRSSDIAQLFSITERAVEFHRLNLRKKLGLKPSESLPEALRSFE